MKVNDVWRNIDKHLSVFVKGSFDQIPATSGVYAWFYPLKVISDDLEELIREFRIVQNYDTNSEGLFESRSELPFRWDRLDLNVKFKLNKKSLPDGIYKQWEETIKSDSDTLSLRKALMSASILMPPLYIGKSNNLRERCAQHVSNDKPGCFKKRFENFSKEQKLSTRLVKELIFVTILAGDDKSYGFSDEQSLIEEILKVVAKPSYGKL